MLFLLEPIPLAMPLFSGFDFSEGGQLSAFAVHNQCSKSTATTRRIETKFHCTFVAAAVMRHQ